MLAIVSIRHCCLCVECCSKEHYSTVMTINVEKYSTGSKQKTDTHPSGYVNVLFLEKRILDYSNTRET